MVDLNKSIADTLKTLANVEVQFPSYENENFPLITINEISNISTYEIEHTEIASEIVFQIDVWDKADTLESVNALAAKVSALMHKNGFRRTLGRGFKDESSLMRNMMQFKIEVLNLKE